MTCDKKSGCSLPASSPPVSVHLLNAEYTTGATATIPPAMMLMPVSRTVDVPGAMSFRKSPAPSTTPNSAPTAETLVSQLSLNDQLGPTATGALIQDDLLGSALDSQTTMISIVRSAMIA